MKIKVADTTPLQLNWLVAMANGVTTFGPPQGRSEAVEYLIMYSDDPALHYSTDWAQGGPIIDREIDAMYRTRLSVGTVIWEAMSQGDSECMGSGPTPLIAAMRCFVASRLGDEVEIPDELK